MQSLFGGGELGLLGGGGDAGGLKEDGCGSVVWHSSQLPPDDVYSASHFALITAYQDIKTRLSCLERENTSIKRKLKIYEIKVKSFHFEAQSQRMRRFFFKPIIIVLVGIRQKASSADKDKASYVLIYEFFKRGVSCPPFSIMEAATLYTDKRSESFGGL